MNNDKLSYQAHENNLKKILIEKEDRLKTVTNIDSLGYKITKRSLDLLSPFLNETNDWLTIGDYNGLEAHYLLERNQKAVASDISDVFLQEAHNKNLIKEFKIINVESIDFSDNSFDYVFCKEAFHHFPKAYLGLYEMIRCSKKATILIEPIDIIGKMPLLLLMKNILDRINPKLINKVWKNRFSFETVGNYVFKISEREIEKMAMGIGLPCIAFKRINLILDLGLDKKVVSETPMNIKGWKKIKRKIRFKNLLSFFRIIPYNHLCGVIFKSKPSNETIKNMQKLGYTIIELPENPYLQSASS